MKAFDNATIKNVVPVATITTDTNGSAVDAAEYDSAVAVLLNASAGSGDMTCNVKLQQSADGSTSWTDISGAAFTQVTTTASSQKIVFNPAGTQRYIRAVVDVGGTTPSFVVGVQLIGEPKYVPAV